MDMGWGEMLGVVVTGLATVFIALILLIIVVTLVGKFFESRNNTKKNNPVKAEVKTAETKPVVKANVVPQVENGISDEVVAAITAAIACMMSDGGEAKPFAIKSIKRTREARNVWNMAGLVENTRPF
ncbi:MAG: OadG family protein [Massiliimalia sp.]|jgi:sodium pump decarboxylase gamma subunit